MPDLRIYEAPDSSETFPNSSHVQEIYRMCLRSGDIHPSASRCINTSYDHQAMMSRSHRSEAASLSLPPINKRQLPCQVSRLKASDAQGMSKDIFGTDIMFPPRLRGFRRRHFARRRRVYERALDSLGSTGSYVRSLRHCVTGRSFQSYFNCHCQQS